MHLWKDELYVLSDDVGERQNAFPNWRRGLDEGFTVTLTATVNYNASQPSQSLHVTQRVIDFFGTMLGETDLLRVEAIGSDAVYSARLSDSTNKLLTFEVFSGTTSLVVRNASDGSFPERAPLEAATIPPIYGTLPTVTASTPTDVIYRPNGNYAVAWLDAAQSINLLTMVGATDAPVAAPASIGTIAPGMAWNLGDWNSTRWSLLTEGRDASNAATVQFRTVLHNGSTDSGSRNYSFALPAGVDPVHLSYHFASNWRAPGSDLVIASFETSASGSSVKLRSIADRGAQAFAIVETVGFDFAGSDPRATLQDMGEGKVAFSYVEGDVLKARIFDASTRTFSEPTVIATGVTPAERGSILNFGDGRLLITWREISQDGATASLVGKIFDTRTALVGISGTNWDDRYAGTIFDDSIMGQSGNDTLFGAAGNDTLAGGAGHDRLDGGDGIDLADYGGETQAVAVNLLLGVTVEAAGTFDTLISIEDVVGSSGDDFLVGNDVANTLSGRSGNDNLWGFGGNDTLNGENGDDVLFGGDGDDTLNGEEGNDVLFGGDGDDTLDGEGGNDVLFGGDGDDRLDGENGDDVLFGGDGNDTLDGEGGNDVLAGGEGNDTVRGGSGIDWLYGQEGDDLIYQQYTPSDGYSVLIGGTGADTLEGSMASFEYFYDGEGATDGFDDLIIVRAHAGIKVMNSFEVGGTNDSIRLVGTPLTSFEQVQANLSFSGIINGTVLDVGTHTQIWFLNGTQPAQLTAADFQFA